MVVLPPFAECARADSTHRRRTSMLSTPLQCSRNFKVVKSEIV
jgi:hypothetical protein